jgi:hypothetical protein
LTDESQLGVFKVSVTLTKTGLYSLRILFKELEVPTSLTQLVKVTPKQATSPLTTGYIGAIDRYLTGDSVKLLITSRD